MNDQLEMLPGTNRDTSRSQYFTPARLAQRVVEWAQVGCRGCGCHREPPNPPGRCCGECPPMRVLEPSAGNGAIVRPLVAAGAEVTAIEIDPRYQHDLLCAKPHVFEMADFLDWETWGKPFDLCVMNPPYHDQCEEKFILHALHYADRVVGIFRADVFYSVSRGENLWSNVRPTRVAFCSRRPWKGAETDYCVLELVQRREFVEGITPCTVEWWPDRWA